MLRIVYGIVLSLGLLTVGTHSCGIDAPRAASSIEQKAVHLVVGGPTCACPANQIAKKKVPTKQIAKKKKGPPRRIAKKKRFAKTNRGRFRPRPRWHRTRWHRTRWHRTRWHRWHPHPRRQFPRRGPHHKPHPKKKSAASILLHLTGPPPCC